MMWFRGQTPDLLGLLQEQAAKTIEGMEALVGWSRGDARQATAIGDAEHEADDIARRLATELRTSFWSPLDPEDIYELSDRLDVVLNSAKNAVREGDVMKVEPNSVLADMAEDLLEGVRRLSEAFAHMTTDPEQATAEADAAIKCERRVERAYRKAVSQLLEVSEPSEIVIWTEMYRRYAGVGESLVRVAQRVWYAAVKES